jgi:hypothetical protein
MHVFQKQPIMNVYKKLTFGVFKLIEL